jgi:hypothetical protein
MTSGEGERMLRDLRRAAGAEAERGPKRAELERRRLVARIGSHSGERRPAAAPGWIVPAIAAACAAALVAIGAALLEDRAPSELRSFRFSGVWRVEPGDPLREGRVLETPVGAGARIELPGGAKLRLGGGARLSLEDGDPSRVRLDGGRLLASVPPRPAGDPLIVLGAAAAAVVRGTTLAASASTGRFAVRLYEGRVEIERGGEAVELRPGREAVVDGEGPVYLREISNGEALADLIAAESGPGFERPSSDFGSRAEPEPPRPGTAGARDEIPPADEKRAASPPRRPAQRAAAGSPGAEERNESTQPPPADKAAAVDAGAEKPDRTRIGIESLRRRLESFPEGRYRRRVRDILGTPEK